MERPGVRVLLAAPGRGLPRAAIDWIAERQRYTRVIVPPAIRAACDLPARLNHEPFGPPETRAATAAGRAAALLDAAGMRAWAIEAVALALLEGGVVVAPDEALFRDLIPFSSWSMNVPARPTDGLLVQHLGIAGRMPAELGTTAAQAQEAVASGDAARIQRVARQRRLAARADGPVRFRRIAKRSAGLRPFVVYLDLLPAAGAAGEPFGAWLRDEAGEDAAALLSTAAAVFI